MANYLDANTDVAEVVALWREPGNFCMPGQFVPYASRGEFLGGIDYRRLDAIKPGPEITVEGYVVGMELLGYRFSAVRQDDGREFLCLADPEPTIPSIWHQRALHLMGAFDRSRTGEAIDFLKAREDGR